MTNHHTESDKRIALERTEPEVRDLLSYIERREHDAAALTGLMICPADEFTVDPETWPDSEPLPEPGRWLWLDTRSGPPTWRVVFTADEAIDAVFAAAGRLRSRSET